jgi:hypothetical protein
MTYLLEASPLPMMAPATNPVVIGAHLDTVFPASTPLQLERKGRMLFCWYFRQRRGHCRVDLALRAAKGAISTPPCDCG